MAEVRAQAAEEALKSAKVVPPSRIDVPVGSPVRAETIAYWADFRVNLKVPPEQAQACVDAGAVFDTTNRVLFVPPRTDLRPLRQWLPFDLDSADVLGPG